MKKDHIENIILLIVVVVVVGGLIFMIKSPKEDFDKYNKQIPQEGYSSTPQQEIKTTGSVDSGDAQIDIAFADYQNGILSFDIAINTHSVDLNQYDLKEITVLKYGDIEIKPISAPVLSGHHNNGLLKFEIEEMPEKYSIIIEGIPAVGNRIFSWE